MLSITPRRTSPLPTLSTPLGEYIQRSYGESPDAYQDDFRALDQLRAAITGPVDPHPATLDALARYYAQLRFVAAKFPIDENSLRIKFPWHPSFKPAKKEYAFAHLAYERASVLFNVGAVYAALGANEAAAAPERACDLFRKAAGVFDELKAALANELRGIPAGDLDLHATTTVECVLQVMLAQAAECVWIKGAKSGSVKDGLLARIAMEVVGLYQAALKAIEGSQAALMEGMARWIIDIKAKQALYSAHAQFRKSLDCAARTLHGESVARLLAAQSQLQSKSALANAHKIQSPIVDLLRALESQIDPIAKAAIKDNDVVYVQPVPKEQDLPAILPIHCAQLGVAPIAFTVDPSLVGRPLFAALVPFEVHQMTSEYTSRKETLASSLIRDIHAWHARGQAALHDSGLPGVLESLSPAGSTRESGLPQASLDRARHFATTLGGTRHIETQIAAMQAAAERGAGMMQEIERVLDQEAREDTEMKAQFQEKWVRTASMVLQRGIRDRVSELKDKLAVAVGSDAFIREKYEAGKGKMAKLEMAAMGGAGLEGMMGEAGTGISPNDPAVRAARELVAQYEGTLKQADALVAEVQDMARADDIATELTAMVARSGNTLMIEKQPLFDKHLAKYDVARTKLAEVETVQEAQVAQIQHAGAELGARMGAQSHGAKQRAAVLNELQSAFDLAQELVSNLKEGHKFYSDLTRVLAELHRQATDFAHARAIEKRELLADLTNAIATAPPGSYPGHAGGSSYATAPPLPPRSPAAQAALLGASAQQAPQPGVWNQGAPPRFARPGEKN